MDGQLFDVVMTEHPGWLPVRPDCPDEGLHRVYPTAEGGRWHAWTRRGDLTLTPQGPAAGEPHLTVFTMRRGEPSQVPELARALRELGAVARFRGTDLWEALGTAIIRQVVRAAQATKLYRAFCREYGQPVCVQGHGTYHLFPTPQRVQHLDDDAFARVGMTFKRHALRSASAMFLEHGAGWRELPPLHLRAELQRVPYIGPWTAGAAVADWSNDWTCYPHGDLAVRTWAARAAPSYPWPTDEAEFARVWRALTSDQLSPLTVLTLAWAGRAGHRPG
jgi:DNA-3-methyladenine glycosylase II